jgi:hypothetical protein
MDVDEKTKIPLWWVGVGLPIFLGFAGWMTSVDSKASEARDKTKNIEEMLTEVRDKVNRIEVHQTDLESYINRSQGGKKW